MCIRVSRAWDRIIGMPSFIFIQLENVGDCKLIDLFIKKFLQAFNCAVITFFMNILFTKFGIKLLVNSKGPAQLA